MIYPRDVRVLYLFLPLIWPYLYFDHISGKNRIIEFMHILAQLMIKYVYIYLSIRIYFMRHYLLKKCIFYTYLC